MMPAMWSLHLTGRTELRDSGGLGVRMPTQRAIVLLAALAFEAGIDVSRSTLCEILWPAVDPVIGRERLRTELASLRRILPKDAIASTHQTVRLNPGILSCELGGVGTFMPGIEFDWVIEQRLRLRAEAVNVLLSEAAEHWNEGRGREAIEAADRAGRIDPHSEEAAAARVMYLEQSGRSSLAVTVSDDYRARAMRDLGVVSNVRPVPVAPEVNPLVTAAEWVLDRDPSEALSLLASTTSQWLVMPVSLALDLHERILRQSASKPSASRSVVEAQRMYLLVLAGRLGPHLREARAAYGRALSAGENLVAARLAGAIAYGFLSSGDFARSCRFAERSVSAARRTGLSSVLTEFETLLGMIRQQAGLTGPAHSVLSKCFQSAEEIGSLNEVAIANLYMADFWIKKDKPDKGARLLETSRRIFESGGQARMMPWILHAESSLYESIGDYDRAQSHYDEIRRIGSAVGGHSVTAMVEDWNASLYCRLGEFDSAAEGFARATIYRRRLGTVPSIYERNHVLPARRTLKERLDPQDLRSAYRRAQESNAGA